MKSCSKVELIKKLSICGQVAEHKSEKMQEAGRDESTILSVLSDTEKDELEALLDKLQKAWIEDHKAHHAKSGS